MDRAGVLDRVRGALWGLFIADALAMPVHWYYDPRVLKRDFGVITTYQAPLSKHPGSIMALSSTGDQGRGGQEGRIIGDVINHGKHQFWGRPGVHYHQGMQAGENTLNALCARVVMRSVAKHGGYDASKVLDDYVAFMTTPGTHNDTYAESFHRAFFSNWARGVPAAQCARGTEGHNTAQIGGFVMLPPVIMAALPRGVNASQSSALQHLALTHESKKLQGYAEKYAGLLAGLACGELPQLQQALTASFKTLGKSVNLQDLSSPGSDDVRVVHSVFGSACYIEDSFPSMLYLAYKYADSFEGAVLANANVGGENCHRGAALGALMGAALGRSRIPDRFVTGLHDSAAIDKEIEAFVAVVFPENVCAAPQ